MLDCPCILLLLLLLLVFLPSSPCSHKSAEFVIHTWPAFVALPKQTHFSSLGFKPNTLRTREEGAAEERRVGGWVGGCKRAPGRLVNAPSHSFLRLFVSIITERCTAHYVSCRCRLTSAGVRDYLPTCIFMYVLDVDARSSPERIERARDKERGLKKIKKSSR